MALVLADTIVISDGGTKATIADTTTYGGSNPARDACLINFLVQDMRSNPPVNITPTYDPVTVTEILVTIPHDGWYKYTMLLTPATGDTPPPDTLVNDELVTARFCICKANFLASLVDKKCGCEDKTKLQELYCLSAQFEGVNDLVAQNDMLSADMAIERMNLECALLNKNCC